MDLERFEELLAAELDGSLTERERTELDSACAEHGGLHRMRVHNLALTSMIRTMGSRRAPADLVSRVMSQMQGELNDDEAISEIETAEDVPVQEVSPRKAPSQGVPIRFIERRGTSAAPAHAPETDTHSDAQPWWSSFLGSPFLRWTCAMAVMAIIIYMGSVILQQSGAGSRTRSLAVAQTPLDGDKASPVLTGNEPVELASAAATPKPPTETPASAEANPAEKDRLPRENVVVLASANKVTPTDAHAKTTPVAPKSDASAKATPTETAPDDESAESQPKKEEQTEEKAEVMIAKAEPTPVPSKQALEPKAIASAAQPIENGTPAITPNGSAAIGPHSALQSAPAATTPAQPGTPMKNVFDRVRQDLESSSSKRGGDQGPPETIAPSLAPTAPKPSAPSLPSTYVPAPRALGPTPVPAAVPDPSGRKVYSDPNEFKSAVAKASTAPSQALPSPAATSPTATSLAATSPGASAPREIASAPAQPVSPVVSLPANPNLQPRQETQPLSQPRNSQVYTDPAEFKRALDAQRTTPPAAKPVTAPAVDLNSLPAASPARVPGTNPSALGFQSTTPIPPTRTPSASPASVSAPSAQPAPASRKQIGIQLASGQRPPSPASPVVRTDTGTFGNGLVPTTASPVPTRTTDVQDIEIAVSRHGGKVLQRIPDPGNPQAVRVVCKMTNAQLTRFLGELQTLGIQRSSQNGTAWREPNIARPPVPGSFYVVERGEIPSSRVPIPAAADEPYDIDLVVLNRGR